MSFNAVYRQALASFFAEADLIRCTEKTFHALYCHHLALAGVPLQSIAREARHDGAPVDVVVYDEAAGGAFSENPSKVLAAFEFKGGAYGSRNALSDTVGLDGFCSDMAKLEHFGAREIPSWFVCVDQSDLGIALTHKLRHKSAEQCRARGLGFAYFCQGEKTFLLAPPGGALEEHALAPRPSQSAVERSLSIDVFAVVEGAAGGMADNISGSEDDYVFRLYHALRQAGCGVQQLSLETYFGFARRGVSRMQLRPDLCLFEASIGGHFNLYRGGRKVVSNDALKLHALRTLIEVKGSVGSAKHPEAMFVLSLERDLDKLANWKAMLMAASADLGVYRSISADFMLIVMDPRPLALSAAALDDLNARATRHGVDFLYRHLSRPCRIEPYRQKLTPSAVPSPVLERALDRSNPTRATEARLYRLTETPRGARDLATYFAAILSVTGMDRGAVFPLNKFLGNFSTHLVAGRIEAVDGGHRLTAAGLAYFEDRYHHARGGALDRVEVAALAAKIRTGGAPGWVPLD